MQACELWQHNNNLYSRNYKNKIKSAHVALDLKNVMIFIIFFGGYIMLSIDSCILAVPSDMVDINMKYFESTTTSPYGEVISMYSKPDIFGFHKVEVFWGVRLHLSSKILLEQYGYGININTIQRVFDVINTSKCIKLKTNELSDFKVHSCDFVANFKTDKPHTNYYQSLNLVNNPRYRNMHYADKNSQGFAFIGKQQKNKYFNFYDKEKELQRTKNREFVKAVGRSTLLEDFKNVIRIEFRAITHKQIRDSCQTPNIQLDHILNSEHSPLYTIYCEIIGNSKIPLDCVLFPENIKKKKDIGEFLYNLGCQCWLNQHNGSIQQALIPINNALRLTEKHNQSTSRESKKYSLKFQAIASSQLNFNSNPNPNEYIDEIRNFLFKH